MLQQSFSFPSFSSGTMEFVVLSSFSYLFWVILLWKYLLLVSPEKKRKLRNKSDITVISKLQCILDETNNETIIPIEPKNKTYINLTLVSICTFITALPSFVRFLKFISIQDIIVNIMITIKRVFILFIHFFQIPYCNFIIVSFYFVVILNAIYEQNTVNFIKM